MLVSIHIASNNPRNFSALMHNLEEVTADPSCIEVVVKIDTEDSAMRETAAAEAAQRPFRIRPVVAPRLGGFADLWRGYNLCHAQMDRGAYFVSLFNDEVRINERGWDLNLRKYVGFFPDGLFRLRNSRVKLRNYVDFWECGFAPDSYAFITREWLDTVDGWNACTGPDTSQQFIAYYLARTSYPSFGQANRDVPIFDISFRGEGASEGLTEEQRQHRATLNFRLWFPLVSHRMQEELNRRACMLRAAIDRAAAQSADLAIECDEATKIVRLVDRASDRTISFYSYKLSRIGLFVANLRRTLHYQYYAGGGPMAWQAMPFSAIEFLAIYYPRFGRLVRPWLDWRPIWIVKQACGMVSRALHRRNIHTLRYEIELFRRQHPGPAPRLLMWLYSLASAVSHKSGRGS